MLDFYEYILAYKPIFDRLCEIAEAKIMQAIEMGKGSARFKIVRGKRSRAWKADVEALELQFGDKIWGEPALLSPAQAEKIFDKKEVAEYVITHEGRNRLVPLSDINEEVSVNASEFD